MNNHNNNSSSAMGPDTIMAQNGYNNDAWASISPYSQSPYGNSPMNEYANFNYMSHGLPSESLNNRMPPPPPQPQIHHHHHALIQPSPGPMAHHHLPALNTTWPSQLTNPTPAGGSYSAPPLSITPVSDMSSAPPVETTRPPPPPDKTRKTLSTEQKRAMCQYYEENPGTRQADIGAKFGVERSTVSKVLRHKDQYLKREHEAENAALKLKKGKNNPDFDRTLSNYVRRQQQGGFQVSDEEIIEHAKLFARASGHQESILKSLTTSWLQKFKQKHTTGTGRLLRRASEANIPDSARMSTSGKIKKEKHSGVVSPVSPDLSPLSERGSDNEDLRLDGLGFDFPYRQVAASQSTTSLASDMRQDANSSFSGSAMSPMAPFTFSPDPNTGGFAVDQVLQTGIDPHHREKRSNTFPSLNLDTINPMSTMSPMTPRHHPSLTAPSSALDSPVHELQAPFPINTALTSPPTLHRSSSNSSITGRTSTTPTTAGVSLDSSPVTPSQEDARRAANTLLNYIHSLVPGGHFDENEYLAVAHLTKKLSLGNSVQRPSIGGLSRIPEGDSEMAMINEIGVDTG